jgi:hypothetical protein
MDRVRRVDLGKMLNILLIEPFLSSRRGPAQFISPEI